MSLLFLFSALDAVYFAIGLILPYHTSFIKHEHPTYTNALIYSALIYIDLGLFFINQWLPLLERRIGVLNFIKLCGFFIFTANLLFIKFTKIIFVFIAYFLFGVSHQIIVFCNVMVLTKKYKSKLVEYTGIVFSGSSLSIAFWGILLKIICNPNNLQLTEKHVNSEGVVEQFFPYQVAEKFPLFAWIYGITGLIYSFVMSWMLDLKAPEKGGEAILGENEAIEPFSNFDDHEKYELQNTYYQSQSIIGRFTFFQIEKIRRKIYKTRI